MKYEHAVWVDEHAFVQAGVHVYVQADVHVYVQTGVHVHEQTDIHVYVQADVHGYVKVYADVYVQVNVQLYKQREFKMAVLSLTFIANTTCKIFFVNEGVLLIKLLIWAIFINICGHDAIFFANTWIEPIILRKIDFTIKRLTLLVPPFTQI